MQLDAPIVLVGTPESIADLVPQIRAIGAPEPSGCVTLAPGGSRTIAGLPVLGHIGEIREIHRAVGIGTAIISTPPEAEHDAARLRRFLTREGVGQRLVPPLRDMLASEPEPPRPAPEADIDLAALIGREPYGIDRRSVARVLENTRIVITGAGGSIGSELARICATFRPELLVLIERSENALFEIDCELASMFPGVARKALLHDVVDAPETERQFKILRPHTVFHAAAHKHVPMMEDHPARAVENNFFGTRSVADAAASNGVERFVMISTDKAVNPRSVMGATKRLAELYVRQLERDTETRFCSVRFGNVLGSTGSVLTIWRRQLADGGPISVTDARMTRYFMTIPEAASLVTQAGAIDDDPADVYVLDMGEPVPIVELAERFVRLHGFEPRVVRDTDELFGWLGAPGATPIMDIELTGVRPGEKLHEQLAYDAEQLRETGSPGIRALAADEESVACERILRELEPVRREPDRDAVVRAIRTLVPTLPATQIEPAANAGRSVAA